MKRDKKNRILVDLRMKLASLKTDLNANSEYMEQAEKDAAIDKIADLLKMIAIVESIPTED